jgi:hypothetical protein
MNRSAKVQSIDAPEHLGRAVARFAADAMVALDEVRMAVHRAAQWVAYDQKDYWSQEFRRADQAMAEARQALERKRIFRVGDQTPACPEEKKALDAAQRRVETARWKLEAVKRWTRELEHESNECRSGIAPLADWLQIDAPRALAMLKRLGVALDSYVNLESQAEPTAAAGGVEPPLEGEKKVVENSPSGS